jgi:hypothetical protein
VQAWSFGGAVDMAYAEFTLDTVHKALGIALRQGVLFETVACLEVPPWLQEALRKGRHVSLLSEKVRSELIVMPLLLTSRELCGNKFAIYSGQRLDVDPQRGLVGECDFILTTTQPMPILRSPIAVILEAKKHDIEASLGQCAAQMVGAQLFIQTDSRQDRVIFGCVTSASGEAWQFLKLDQTTLTIDWGRYYIDNVGRILGMFQAIVACFETGSVAA